MPLFALFPHVSRCFTAHYRLIWRCSFRQGGELAEGEKSEEVKQFSIGHPPPPANWNWHDGSNSSRKTHVLPIRERHLAEGVHKCEKPHLAICRPLWPGGFVSASDCSKGYCATESWPPGGIVSFGEFTSGQFSWQKYAFKAIGLARLPVCQPARQCRGPATVPRHTAIENMMLAVGDNAVTFYQQSLYNAKPTCPPSRHHDWTQAA